MSTTAAPYGVGIARSGRRGWPGAEVATGGAKATSGRQLWPACNPIRGRQSQPSDTIHRPTVTLQASPRGSHAPRVPVGTEGAGSSSVVRLVPLGQTHEAPTNGQSPNQAAGEGSNHEGQEATMPHGREEYIRTPRLTPSACNVSTASSVLT